MPFLKGNTFAVNTLLFLGLLTFILIGIDLGSELSVKNDEINYVIASLEDLSLNLSFNSSGSLIIDLPVVGIVPVFIFSNGEQELFTIPEGRAPPLV